MALTTMRFLSGAAQNKPLIAALLASVPEPVKITSLGAQPSARAITSRASSTSLRVDRPSV